MTTKITEEDGTHRTWYDEKPKTPADLHVFVTKLLTEYGHDYGTIVHAAAAAAVAAARTVNADENQGGLTGFQASAVMWQFIQKWMHLDGPMKLTKFSDMLYPQYERQFRTISLETFRWLQDEARKRLASDGSEFDGEKRSAHPNVVAHWKRTVDGEVPFGYQINE